MGRIVKIVADNKKSRFNYEISETFEAGVVLMGSEIKSIRQNGCSLKESYVSIKDGELYLQKSHIAPYLSSSYNNHEPERTRKLLLNRHEILKIMIAITEKGMSCVPTKLYLKNGRAKIEIGLGKGKKLHDKRESITKRDVNRQVSRALKKSR